MVGNPAAALDGGLFSGEVVGPLPFGANEGVAGAACQKQDRHREHERVAGVALCCHGVPPWMDGGASYPYLRNLRVRAAIAAALFLVSGPLAVEMIDESSYCDGTKARKNIDLFP